MAETGKVAIARVVIRSKENLVAVRAMDNDVLGMTTMIFPDEVVDPHTVDDVPDPDEVEVTDRELAIAKQLVDSLAGTFEPEKFHDTYREEVLAVIERKAAGEEIAVQPPSEDVTAPVPDLMSALKASLDAVRKDGGAGDGDGAAAKGNGSSSRSKAKSSSGTKKSSSSRSGSGSRAKAKK
jgi:DNA end-binding protein Ku